MYCAHWCTLFVAAALPAAAAAQSPAVRSPVAGAPAGAIALINVNVVPMDTERILTNYTVVVEGGRITALGPSSRVRLPPRTTQIDGKGRYLMPGLADMHVHLGEVTYQAARGQELVSSQLFYFVAQGVTLIRNMDRSPNRMIEASRTPLQARAWAAAGKILSPRIYTSGPWMTSQDYTDPAIGHADTMWRLAPAEVASRLAAYQAKGYDFIKPYFESPEIFDSVAAAARRLGIPLEGHVPPEVPLTRALAVRMRSIEHATGYLKLALDTATISTLADATSRAGVWNCPTLAIHARLTHNWLATLEATPERAKDVAKLRHQWAMQRQLAKALQDAGAGLLLGTDNSDQSRYGILVTDELRSLVDAGLTPYQALAAGTRNAAVFLGWQDDVGTVTVGKRADLILLAGNPLQDVGNTAQPIGVMLGGRWVTREEIDRHVGSRP